MRDWEPVSITLQALSLVEKAELVQVRFTLRLRDQRSMWLQDGCKVYMDSYMALNGPCFMVTWTIFQKSPLGGGSDTKHGDEGNLNAHNHWFILFLHVWGFAWIALHFKHSHWWKRRSWSKFTSHYAWGTNGVCDCKTDVKSTWFLTWHWMDHVSWSLGLFFKNHLLEVGLTQNMETKAIWILTTVGLFYFYMCEDSHE
jgi:hypothetical protein